MRPPMKAAGATSSTDLSLPPLLRADSTDRLGVLVIGAHLPKTRTAGLAMDFFYSQLFYYPI